MSALRAAAGEYLAMRRALGFMLTAQGRHLMSFVAFCEERGAVRVTADLAAEWATRTARGSGDEVYQARRLDAVRIRRPAPAGARPGHRDPDRGRAVTPAGAGPGPFCTPRRRSPRS